MDQEILKKMANEMGLVPALIARLQGGDALRDEKIDGFMPPANKLAVGEDLVMVTRARDVEIYDQDIGSRVVRTSPIRKITRRTFLEIVVETASGSRYLVVYK